MFSVPPTLYFSCGVHIVPPPYPTKTGDRLNYNSGNNTMYNNRAIQLIVTLIFVIVLIETRMSLLYKIQLTSCFF